MKPKHPRWEVTYEHGVATVIYMRGSDKERIFRLIPENFIFGRPGFRDCTLEFPDYIHEDFWKLHEAAIPRPAYALTDDAD